MKFVLGGLEFGTLQFNINQTSLPVISKIFLAAPGVSILRDVYSINRGYEELAARLNSLGAEIEVIIE